MKAILVHNPTAGDYRYSRGELTDLLHRTGITPFYQSSKVGELTAALAEPADLIVVAGGDGTVAKVLTQMPNRNIPVGILPVGTANNIASSFGIGGSLEEIAVRLSDAERQKLDIGMARGPWGCCWVVEGMGMGALVRAAKRTGKAAGRRARRLQAARHTVRRILREIVPDRVKVMLDGQPLPEESLMLEVLNITCGGPRLLMVPDVSPGDGLLNVIMVEPHQRKAMCRWLNDKRPNEPPPVSRWRGSKVSMIWNGTPLHIDDDLPQPEPDLVAVELKLVSDPVTILVPHVDA